MPRMTVHHGIMAHNALRLPQESHVFKKTAYSSLFAYHEEEARMSTDSCKKFLDPKTVAAISNYRLVARLIIEGFLMGLHRGPRHAFSLEYSKHRDYYPGDPLKLVDWKIYGKTDHFFVKQYEEETNLQAWLLLDISQSMSYQGDQARVSKLRYASYLAAALCYLLLEQRDLAGLVLFDDRLRKVIQPSSAKRQLNLILKELTHLKEGHRSHFEESAKLVAGRVKRRSLFILFSDLLSSPEEIETTLKHFLHGGSEVIVFHLLTHEEMKFPFERFGFFEDLETKERVLLQPKFLKDEYAEKMELYLNRIKKICGKLKVQYQFLQTTDSFEKPLRLFLESRKRMN